MSVILPPEILDKILDHVPICGKGRPTLIACALVATWWTGPSQRRLFSSVDIYEGNYGRWMGGVVLSESKARLLGCVRSLWHRRGLDSRIKYQMRHLAQDSGEYFSALHNIRNLTFFNTRIEHISEDQFRICFSAFRDTLTHLSLDAFATSFSAFMTLVGYFPNITTLELRSFELEPDEGPVPSLSRPLRGKLCIRDIHDHCLEFLDRFAKLDLEYEELVIDASFLFIPTPESRFLESALRISTGAVKFLRLTVELRCEQPSLPLIKPCPYPTLSRLSRNSGDDQQLSTTPRVGTIGQSPKSLSQSLSLFNHLHKTPEGYLPSAVHAQFEDFLTADEGLGFDRQTIVSVSRSVACGGILSYPGGGTATYEDGERPWGVRFYRVFTRV